MNIECLNPLEIFMNIEYCVYFQLFIEEEHFLLSVQELGREFHPRS